MANVNGKLYIAHKAANNRISVYDPNLSTTTVRLAGLIAGTAPTAANQGAGAYAAAS